MSYNEEPEDGNTNEPVNSNRETGGSNDKQGSPHLDLGDINPASDCPWQNPVSVEQTDYRTGEIIERQVTKPCGSKKCPVCGPKLRAQMFEHYKRKVLNLDGLQWVGLTLDEEELTPSESRKAVQEVWRSFYDRVRYMCGKNDVDFNYIGTRDQDREEDAHLHCVLSTPGVDNLDVRSAWFKSGGGIVAYAEDVENEERLEQALGYCLLRHFQEARRARSLNYRVPEPLDSRSVAFNHEKAKQARREAAQRKATESGGAVSFRDMDEYTRWLSRYLSDAEDRSVQVVDQGKGVALEWDEDEIVVQFKDGTITDSPTEDVLPCGVDTVTIDKYSSAETPDESQPNSGSDDTGSDSEEVSPDLDPESRSTEYVTTEGMHQVRYFWDEDAQRVRRDTLALADLDVYRKLLKSGPPCPSRSPSFAPKTGVELKPKSLLSPSEVKEEEWKPVVGYEAHYSVSNWGRVRRNGRGNILNTSLTKSGYPCVSLHVNGDGSTHRVHTLVAKAFIGDPPGSIGHEPGEYQINHKNRDRTDNRPENLEWVTHMENMKHAFEENRQANTGEGHGNSKLSWVHVEKLHMLKEETDLTYKEIGKRFGVTDSRISQIVNGKGWKPEDRPPGK